MSDSPVESVTSADLSHERRIATSEERLDYLEAEMESMRALASRLLMDVSDLPTAPTPSDPPLCTGTDDPPAAEGKRTVPLIHNKWPDGNEA